MWLFYIVQYLKDDNKAKSDSQQAPIKCCVIAVIFSEISVSEKYFSTYLASKFISKNGQVIEATYVVVKENDQQQYIKITDFLKNILHSFSL